jgi:sucrose-6-phosphate hydrolase SacC (GH32 family)
VLLGASSEYRVGLFDGTKFIAESPKVPGHRGKGFYAAQSFSDVPDGRRILIGWFQTETKGMPFNQSMTIPLELGLTQTEDGPRMTFAPVKELEVLRARTHRLGAMALSPGDQNPLGAIRAELVELRAEFEPMDASEVVFNTRDVMVIYDPKKQELSVAGHKAAAPLRDGKQRLAIFCDRTGIEVFASDGLCYVPMPFNMNAENRGISFETRGGAAKINSLEVHELRSAWER